MTGLRTRIVATPLVLASLCATLASQGKISWQTDFADAMSLAKKENKVIACCISMDGERVCDVIVDEHYTDKEVVDLSKHTINLFCSPHGTPAQRELEKRVRLDLLKKEPGAVMVAPQHVFLTPAGELISSVSYYIAIGELEWMWAEAIRTHDESFSFELSERARAPRALQSKKIATTKKLVPPPTRKELDEILREIKKGFGGYYGAKDKLHVIVRHPSSQARKFVERILTSIETDNSERIHVLETIARNSPREWWKVVAPMTEHEYSGVRTAAVQALAELGESRAVTVLNGRWRKEDDPMVKCALLHALVACGPSNRKVVDVVPFVIEDYDDERIRLAATHAAAGLESRDAVTESLTTALDDTSPRVRAAAAYVIASRRELGMAEALDKALGHERDADTKRWMQEAKAVLEGASMDAFDEFEHK